MIRIVFLGTPRFAVPFLEALAAEGDVEIAAVVSQPDKPSGRGNEVKATPTKTMAQALDIPVLQPVSLKKDPTIAETLRELKADLFVVVAYGKLIPKEILDLPRLGCVNVHPSLLPRWRGPAPMQFTIAQGDAQSAVTIMKLDEGMDTGPLLAQKRFAVAADETCATLEAKVHAIGVPLLIETLKGYATGTLKPVPQSAEGVTATRLLDREDGQADWSLPAKTLDARRRAYAPWPGLWTMFPVPSRPNPACMQAGEAEGSLRVKILQTSVDETILPRGHVRRDGSDLLVGCGKGSLRVSKIQPEDSKPMSAEAFLNGHPDIDGAQLA